MEDLNFPDEKTYQYFLSKYGKLTVNPLPENLSEWKKSINHNFCIAKSVTKYQDSYQR